MFLTILSGVRWKIGTDWDPYYYFFEQNGNFEEFITAGFEPGYAILNYLIKLFFGEYSLVLFIVTGTIIFLKYRVIFLYSVFPLLSICLNFANYNGDIFPVRQYIAVAMTLWSIEFIIKRQLYWFIIVVLLASSFHFTAVIFLPAYYIYYKNFSRKNLTIITMISIFIGSSGIIEKTIEIFLSGFGGIENLFIIKLEDYLDAKEAGNNFGYAFSSTAAIVIGILRRSVFLPFIIYFKSIFMKCDEKYNGLLNLTICGYCLYFVLSGISIAVAGRLSLYYNIFEIFVIPYFLLLSKKLEIRIFMFGIFFIFIIMKYWFGLYGFYDLYVPFRTIFD